MATVLVPFDIWRSGNSKLSIVSRSREKLDRDTRLLRHLYEKPLQALRRDLVGNALAIDSGPGLLNAFVIEIGPEQLDQEIIRPFAKIGLISAFACTSSTGIRVTLERMPDNML